MLGASVFLAVGQELNILMNPLGLASDLGLNFFETAGAPLQIFSALTNAFHSSGVFGGVFQLSGIGVERRCCISGLTVFGIGSVRAGICRGAGVVWTLPSVAANRNVTRVQRTASSARSAKRQCTVMCHLRSSA